MYQQKLMDHYRSSAHRGVVQNPTFSSKVHNPSCGDTVAVAGRVIDGILVELKFTGAGCVISQAAASLLCEAMEGKPYADVARVTPETMQQLLGTQLGPTRLRCALLALEALQTNA
jgi:nitrogen fixation protein NifU and related proteins